MLPKSITFPVQEKICSLEANIQDCYHLFPLPFVSGFANFLSFSSHASFLSISAFIPTTVLLSAEEFPSSVDSTASRPFPFHANLLMVEFFNHLEAQPSPNLHLWHDYLQKLSKIFNFFLLLPQESLQDSEIKKAYRKISTLYVLTILKAMRKNR